MAASIFWKQFKPKSCSINLKASSKDEALAEVVDNMIAAEALTEDLRQSAVDALLGRERVGSTGVGTGVAIPHVKIVGLKTAVCSLSVHVGGIEWAAIDGAPVHLLFTVLRPEKASDAHDPDKHLEMMRWVSRLSRDGDFRRFAVRVKSKTELVDLLKEKSTV